MALAYNRLTLITPPNQRSQVNLKHLATNIQ